MATVCDRGNDFSRGRMSKHSHADDTILVFSFIRPSSMNGISSSHQRRPRTIIVSRTVTTNTVRDLQTISEYGICSGFPDSEAIIVLIPKRNGRTTLFRFVIVSPKPIVLCLLSGFRVVPQSVPVSDDCSGLADSMPSDSCSVPVRCSLSTQ